MSCRPSSSFSAYGTEKEESETESVADDSLLKKQLDQKWRTLDQFEASLRKLEAHKLQWKAKYAIKEGELEAAKVCLPAILINPTPDTHIAILAQHLLLSDISQAQRLD